ncbi:ImuA family protein [Algicella marina]|uniref:Protein ImuA n=1 Tax=Algicella marina TaxID=2683284 RepID=A0A6P1SXI3_9RHOB|nr:hypothetical protein [Algicella marina]QHQ33916.1 hypothetical protein GO499_01325 [Algicella marina]
MSALSRSRPVPTALLTPAPGLMLLKARAHEACGPARHSFAMMLARAASGPVFWIRHALADGRMNGCGIIPWLEPARLIFVTASRANDLLWTVEEVLRSGVVPLVVAELPEPPPLTPVRRLHLAAESTGSNPTALLLTPGDGGAQGVESRWHMAPAPGWAAPGGHPAWTLTRRRARMAPEAAWHVERRGDSLHTAPVAIPEPA